MFVETSSITLYFNDNDNTGGVQEQDKQQHQLQKDDPNCSSTNTTGSSMNTPDNRTNTGSTNSSCTGSNSNSNSNSNTITLKGYSRGGDGTCFIIPEYKWMLDCGAPIISNSGWLPTTIFLTHTHADHIYNLTRILHNTNTINTTNTTNTGNSKQKQKQQQQKSTITIYAPAGCVQYLQNYLDAHLQLINYQKEDTSINDCNDINNDTIDNCNSNICSSSQQETTTTDDTKNTTTDCNYTIIPVQPGEQYALTTTKYGGYQYYVQIVQCYHRMECVGYSFYRTSTKLKQQCTNLSNEEIKKLIICQNKKSNKNNYKKQKQQNQQKEHEVFFSLKETIKQSLLLFLGDTTHDVFNNTLLLTYHKYIIVECTFLFDNNNNNIHKTSNNNNNKQNSTIVIDTTIEKANVSHHMHWIHLQKYIQQFSNTLFILIHFSLRYNQYMIRQFFNQQQYRNIHPILNESEILYNWQQEQERTQQTGAEKDKQCQNLLQTNYNDNANNNKNNNTPPKCICFMCNPTTSAKTTSTTMT